VTSKIAVTHPSLTDQVGKQRQLPFLIEARPQSANTPLNELLDWMADTKAWREELLHRAGAILFRGFTAIRTAEDFCRSGPEYSSGNPGLRWSSHHTAQRRHRKDCHFHRSRRNRLASEDELPGSVSGISRSYAGQSDVFLRNRTRQNKLVSHGRQPYSPPRTNYAALLADKPGVRLHSKFLD
jgi:hypothetical protein